MIPGRYRVEAPAKVNLFLRILGRRPDGYHELETAFQAVNLSDILEVVAGEGDGFELMVRAPDGAPVDVGPVENNLVTRAVEIFRDRTGRSCAVQVRLTKRIPAGAGLGGGSSDAGAMLRVLNRIHGMPLSAGELQELAGTLGADVAFFAGEVGLALGEGVGTELTPLAPLPPRRLIVGMPPAHVATGPAYGLLARSREGTELPPRILDQGDRRRAAQERQRDGELVDAEGDAVGPGLLWSGSDPWASVARRAVNDFQSVVSAAWPQVSDALKALARPGVAWSLLSGSGAAVFGVLEPNAPVDVIVAGLRASCPETRWEVCSTLGELPPVERVEDDAGMM